MRGTISASPAGKKLPTIENGHAVSLKPGEYVVTMSEWTSRHSGKKGRCLRVHLTPEQFEEIYGRKAKRADERNHILVHVGCFPWNFEGCVGPGLKETENGVADSANAVQQLFDDLGGFRIGGRFVLEVL